MILMTTEKYIEQLQEAQRTLTMVKEDLDRAIKLMQRRSETGDKEQEQLSRLSALSSRDYLKEADARIRETALTPIK